MLVFSWYHSKLTTSKDKLSTISVPACVYMQIVLYSQVCPLTATPAHSVHQKALGSPTKSLGTRKKLPRSLARVYQECRNHLKLHHGGDEPKGK